MYNAELDIPAKHNQKTVIIDFDTPLVKAALAVQESYIMVKHKQTGWEQEFKNVTTFYGRGRAKDKGWIGTQNEKRADTGKPLISADDFEITTHSRITDEDFVAFGRLKNMLEAITKLPWVKDYKILVGGKGNFRDDIAKITKYKGDRPEKPLRFNEVKSWLLNKYSDKIIQKDGIEADDVVGWYSFAGLQQAKKTGRNPYVLAFVDKDLYQLEGWVLNYNKEEMTCVYNTEFEAGKHFFCQMLAGDKTDCIVGLPELTEEIRTKYELRKTRGIGMPTAEKLLDGSETVKEMAERVHEAYQSFYGIEPFEFECWEGNKSQRTYLDMMDENSILLRMQAFEGHQYKISDTLKKLEIIDA
tara:strand:+ start:9468 stop:10541 length:1074 start_codon:yes stop_codon:yes gene_type:complete